MKRGRGTRRAGVGGGGAKRGEVEKASLLLLLPSLQLPPPLSQMTSTPCTTTSASRIATSPAAPASVRDAGRSRWRGLRTPPAAGRRPSRRPPPPPRRPPLLCHRRREAGLVARSTTTPTTPRRAHVRHGRHAEQQGQALRLARLLEVRAPVPQEAGDRRLAARVHAAQRVALLGRERHAAAHQRPGRAPRVRKQDVAGGVVDPLHKGRAVLAEVGQRVPGGQGVHAVQVHCVRAARDGGVDLRAGSHQVDLHLPRDVGRHVRPAKPGGPGPLGGLLGRVGQGRGGAAGAQRCGRVHPEPGRPGGRLGLLCRVEDVDPRRKARLGQAGPPVQGAGGRVDGRRVDEGRPEPGRPGAVAVALGLQQGGRVRGGRWRRRRRGRWRRRGCAGGGGVHFLWGIFPSGQFPLSEKGLVSRAGG